MEILHSVEAMINTDGKNYKGTLDFYNSRCILHSTNRKLAEFKYDLKEAEFTSGITKISFLDLYTKEKRYIQIKMGQSVSPMFIIDDDIVDETLNILKHSHSREAWREDVSVGSDEDSVNDYDESVLTFFLNNPYRVLGIPTNASKADANEAIEKIKRLDRLKVIQSYKTDYHLVGFPPVVRNLPGCQNALASLKIISNKFFWFNSAEACKNWKSEEYRSIYLPGTSMSISFDTFLAQYLYVLIYDSEFEQRSQWHKVFAGYQYIVGEKRLELLREKLNKEESLKITDVQLINEFSKHIFDPLDKLLEDARIESILSLFRSIRIDKYPTLKEYKKRIGGTIAQWALSRERDLWEKIEDYIGKGELNDSAVMEVRKAAEEYDESIQHVFENILNALTMEPLRADMVKTSYIKVMERIMVLLVAGGRKSEAAKYGAKLYSYADDQLKLKILSLCEIDSIPSAAIDLPKLLPEKKNKEMVSPEDFEDITICEISSSLPRVDFCGLEFNYNSIGIRFWISNKTDTILKFWLMDVEINGNECCSTEIICEVSQNEYNYYTYELSIPDDVSYYNIKNLVFYVEIDKPGNDTIYDTEIVRVNCNTITEKFSAEYDI